MTSAPMSSVISEVGRSYLRLQRVPDVGPIRARNLVAHFGSVEAIWSASMAELQHVEGIGPHVAESIFRSRDDKGVEEEIAKAADCELRILCPEDDEYPKPLLHIPDPPICLYVRGTLQPADSVAVAIVGTRRCSHYGREQALRFGEALARAGFTIVSGLARGIDGEAHRGALRGGGRTIAVLGNGLGAVYPPEHGELADEIAQSGALVSELEVDIAPDAKNFPSRNRIIVGLSLGVVVIEAGDKSGALITARLASEYNREVFALPGPIDRPAQNAGSNALIRDGQAKLITSLTDILDELGEVGRVLRTDDSPPAPQSRDPADAPLFAAANLAEHERAIVEAIVGGIEDVEGICASTRLDAGSVTSTLTSLQLRGLIRQLPGNRFVCRANAVSEPRAQARGPRNADSTDGCR
jgi:DNA processing protein